MSARRTRPAALAHRCRRRPADRRRSRCGRHAGLRRSGGSRRLRARPTERRLHAGCGGTACLDRCTAVARRSGEQALALAAQGVLDDIAQPLAEAGVAPVMAAVVCRALAVDPHRRGTAADLALDLRHSGEPLAVELAAGRARPEPAAVPRSGPRHAARPGAPVGGGARAPHATPSGLRASAGEPTCRRCDWLPQAVHCRPNRGKTVSRQRGHRQPTRRGRPSSGPPLPPAWPSQEPRH